MPVPAAIALPAAIAGAAYLNARWRLPEDRRVFTALITSTRHFNARLKADRINSFYLLEDHAQNPQVKDKIFIVYEGKTWTFKQTYDQVLRYAGWLKKTHKVQPGEFVAVDMMNCAEYCFVSVAIWSLGATPALINYNLVGEPLVHSIRTGGARLLIIEPEVVAKALTPEVRAILGADNFRNGAFPLEIATLSPELCSSLAYFPPYRAPDSARSGAIGRTPAALIMTSGTTGLPKAAVVPFERTCLAGESVGRWMGMRPVTDKHPDRYYTAMPLYHSSAFQLGFHMCMVTGVTIVIGRKFSVSNFWKEVVDSQATIVQYVGETLRYLLAVPPAADDKTKHNVRMAFGNGLRADVWDRFRDRFGVENIAEFYGATEGTGGTFNFSRNRFSSGYMGSAGAIMALIGGLTTVRVEVDWETEQPWRDPRTGFCKKVKKGEPGELIMKVDEKDVGKKFQGYHNNPEATKKKILRDVFKKGDAYFRTGDVVIQDTENRYWFSDRIGDTFRWKSENVSTAEVSEVMGHHPIVLEANVYGVSVPGHEGRAGCAAVLLHESCFKNPLGGEIKEDILESMATWCTNSLPKYAVPLFIRVLKEVVTTGNNKQQKHVLRKQGVDPDVVKDKVYWLRPGSGRYEPFGRQEWQLLKGGRVKL